jgi:D-alanyl-D-alanine carboxypeptidase
MEIVNSLIFESKKTKKRDNQMSKLLDQLINKQKEREQIEQLREAHQEELNRSYYDYYRPETKQISDDLLYAGLRDIKMTDDETWFLIFDINQILKLHIPKNERQREDFMFLRSLKKQIAKDNRISEKQITWYENIREYVNV